MAEKETLSLRLLIALSVIACVVGAAALINALVNTNEQRDLRDRLADAEQRAAQRDQALHDRDARLTATRAGDAEAVRQDLEAQLQATEEHLADLDDRFRRLPVEPAPEEPETPPTDVPSRFVGQGGNVHHIVYLIERTEALAEDDRFEALRNEITKSISRLYPVQDFCVIFYGGPELLEAPAGGLVLATPVNQAAIRAFVDAVGPAGAEANLTPALDRAIRMLKASDEDRPGRIIYLLAGTTPSDADEAIELVRQHATPQSIYVNTFLYGPDNPDLDETLRQLAVDSGGRFKHVTSEMIAEMQP